MVFMKRWLFSLGGCPAIYQAGVLTTNSFHPSCNTGYVRFEGPGGDKDFTFERSGAFFGEELPLLTPRIALYWFRIASGTTGFVGRAQRTRHT